MQHARSKFKQFTLYSANSMSRQNLRRANEVQPCMYNYANKNWLLAERKQNAACAQQVQAVHPLQCQQYVTAKPQTCQRGISHV